MRLPCLTNTVIAIFIFIVIAVGANGPFYTMSTSDVNGATQCDSDAVYTGCPDGKLMPRFISDVLQSTNATSNIKVKWIFNHFQCL